MKGFKLLKEFGATLSLAIMIPLGLPNFSTVIEDQPVPEYVLKALYIFNFAKFTEWPPESFNSPTDPFRFCISGEDPFGGALAQALSQKTLHNRRIEIQIFQPNDIARMSQCHILFIKNNKSNLKSILSHLKHKPILTVGESENFNQLGGDIYLMLEHRKLRFQVNVDALNQSGLKVSSNLLKMAKIYKESP